ncbi:TPA: hypothetical protein ACFU2V_001838 [Neisseria subflava]
MKSYVVLEQHFGDKQYWAGDTRELLEDDAADLIALGLISESADSESEGDKDKSLGDSPKNKDEPVTPAGKESVPESKDNPDPEGNSKDGKN